MIWLVWLLTIGTSHVVFVAIITSISYLIVKKVQHHF